MKYALQGVLAFILILAMCAAVSVIVTPVGAFVILLILAAVVF